MFCDRSIDWLGGSIAFTACTDRPLSRSDLSPLPPIIPTTPTHTTPSLTQQAFRQGGNIKQAGRAAGGPQQQGGGGRGGGGRGAGGRGGSRGRGGGRGGRGAGRGGRGGEKKKPTKDDLDAEMDECELVGCVCVF
jgi:hypothetical protein